MFGRNNVTFNKNIYVKGLKTVSAHPVSYKSLFVDASTGKVYSQNAVSSIGNADSLGHQSPSYYRDTFNISYCNGCALNSGWIRSGDSIMIDTSYFGLIRSINDSLTNQRTDINALYDTASEHRVILDAHSDSIANLRTETNRLSDSITEHRVVINSIFDSLSNHRIEINNINDSLLLTQKTRDTITWDATKYFVTSQGYLISEVDPIYTSDSSDILFNRDTVSLLATRSWSNNTFMPKNTNVRDSIYLKLGSVNSSDGWYSNDTIKLRNDYLLTESDPIWVSDSSNYASKSGLAKMVTDTSYFDGNRTILQSGWTGVSGTNKGTGTVKDFLEAVFFPFVPATININSGTSVLKEVGTSTSNTISGTTTANSETIFSNGYVVWTYPLPAYNYYSFGANLTYSTTFTFTPMQDSTTGANAMEVRFRSQQDVDNNGSPTTIYSATKYMYSVYPYLYGTDSTSALIIGGVPFYSAMTKSVSSLGDKTVGFNTSDLKYFWFAYPATYADLTSILDQNGFEQITNFTKYTVNVSSTGLTNDWDVSYKIYRSNAKAFTVGTWNYQFIY